MYLAAEILRVSSGSVAVVLEAVPAGGAGCGPGIIGHSTNW